LSEIEDVDVASVVGIERRNEPGLASAQVERGGEEPEVCDIDMAVAATDRQIDRIVYDLYGLTEEEIRIVEEGTA
jgi:hypothetical protein